jgi:inner membrane protein involved in colicin E2 resistance
MHGHDRDGVLFDIVLAVGYALVVLDKYIYGLLQSREFSLLVGEFLMKTLRYLFA